MRWACLILAGLLLAACAASTVPAAEVAELEIVPSQTRMPAATTKKPVEGKVVIHASDGLELSGTLFSPEAQSPPWPGVILLHMIYGDNREWGEFPRQLTEAGYAVLALDMRGHGKTGGEMDWDQARDDLRRVYHYLSEIPDIDPARLAVIGASMGANMALGLASETPQMRAAGLLSPGLDYYHVTTADKLKDYGGRPLLILVSDEDGYAAESVRKLKELAEGEVELVVYSQAGHGTAMFQKEPGIPETIIDWLDLHLMP
jgi:dienelactone hydrolase